MLHSKNLEIHVADHCNLDCVGCTHASPLLPRRYEDVHELATALTTLWRFYRADRVRLVGGEPLLHPAFADLVVTVKQVTGALVQLVTNAMLLERRLDRLGPVDEIEVSLYPGVRQPEVERLQEIATELGVPVCAKEYSSFRWHRRAADGDQITTQRIFRTCQMFHHCECHTVRAGRFHPCPPAATWAAHHGDGADLLGDPVEAAAAVRRLLVRDHALGSCTECLGSAGSLLPHQQGWRARPDWEPEMLLDQARLQMLEQQPDAHNGCHGADRLLAPAVDDA